MRHRSPDSPSDGRWIAYLRNVSGLRDVYVIPRLGGEPERLTFRPESTNVRKSPFLSFFCPSMR
jgi:hypothetical protein